MSTEIIPIYRISDTGYNKVKPDYINNENCLRNFVDAFYFYRDNIIIIADNISSETNDMIQKYVSRDQIYYVSCGDGAKTFNIALDIALKYDDNDIIYFVENDYIHLKRSPLILREIHRLGAPYGTLYLHPDKFIPPHLGGNPEVDEDGGYYTKLYKGDHNNIFQQVNSTTMTFSAKVKTLKEDKEILRKHTSGTHPNDFQMFLELRSKGKMLLCPTNTYSTHGETKWLAPLYNVSNENLVQEWGEHIKRG